MAEQHVDELGDFIEVGIPQKSADRTDTRVVVNSELRPIHLVEAPDFVLHFIGADNHCPELQASERLSIHTLTFVFEENRSRRSNLDDQNNDQYNSK
jgi:hypothetical protein